MSRETGRFNPFPGLRPFEADEDYLFFGRERNTDELVRRLRRNRILAVIGGSGSGKSSLVRSGLIPSLHGGSMARAGSHWRIALMRPGEDPVGKLAEALSDACVLGGVEHSAQINRAIVEATLRSSARGLADAVHQAHLPEFDNVLVVVDQFEELFRFRSSRKGPARDDAVAFVKLLLGAAAEPDSAYVVITMRADFIGNCMEYPGLPEAINEGQYLIPRMTREELRSAITGPVAVGGGTIAPRLVTRLLNEAGDDPNLLPVLQHALMRTWECREKSGASGPLDIAHYEAIGTIRHALSQHAEEAFAELGSDAKRASARAMFQALTETDQEGRAIRTPCTVEQLSAVSGASDPDVIEVVECFRRPGRAFLTPLADVPLRAESIVDLSHESLIRVWDRLGTWVRDDRESTMFYRRLSDCARDHDAGTESLWRNPQLALGLRWLSENRHNAAWAERHGGGFERAVRFIEDSRKADRRRRVALIGAAALGVLLVLGIVLTYALAQRENSRLLAKTNRALEERNKELTSRVSGLETGNTKAADELGALLAQTRKLEADFDAACADRNRKAEQVRQFTAARDELSTQQRDLQGQKATRAAEVMNLLTEVTALVERAARLRDENGVLKARLQGVQQENSRLNAALRRAGIDPPLSSDRSVPPPRQPSGAGLLDSVDPLTPPRRIPPVRAAEDRLDQLSSENRRLRDLAAQLQRESGVLSAGLQVVRAENAAMEREIAAVRGQERKLIVEADQIKAEAAKLRAAVARLQDEVRALGNRAVDLREQESDLQFQIATLRTDNGLISTRIASTEAENERWSGILKETTKP